MRFKKGFFIFAFTLVIILGFLGSTNATVDCGDNKCVTCSDFGYDYGVVGDACDGEGYDLSGCYNEVTTCSEQDGGMNFFTYSSLQTMTTTNYGPACGGVSTPGSSEAGRNFDFCQGDVLTEFYCGEEGERLNEKYDCLNGCDNGACLEEVAPTCSVDYLEQKDSHNEYDFSDTIYIPEDGSFYIYGDSNDEDSGIFNVQYNRTSPNLYLLWTDSDPTDGGFSENDEEWRSDPNDGSFVDGWHEVCCRAEDNVHNVQTPGECQEFCIDTQEPEKVKNVINANPSECMPNYVNDEIVFSWDDAKSNGCAPIDYYEINVYLSDGTFVGEYNTEETTFTIEEPENGQDYYIKVRAVDAAENEGDWSDASDHIYFDDENPGVEIVSPDADSWFNKDFIVNETESDNLGLFECQYKIVNNEGEAVWTVMEECNMPLNIDISEFCPEDGTCTVYKKAIDNACNEETDSRTFNIDTTAPETIKTISEPKYLGRLFEWLGISYDLDWFLGKDAKISFECVDSGIGCEEIGSTFYKINDGTWTEYNGSFSLGEDGIYEVKFYSRDKLGNIQTTQYEFDKVDTQAPVTIKTISGPTYYDEENERLWVNADTEFTMECSDSEVGCEMTSFTVDGENEQSSNDTLTFTLNSLVDSDGEHNIDFWSRDYLGNEETPQNEVDWLDTHLPIIVVHNPTDDETEVGRCTQAIVIEAYEVEDVIGSGLNEGSIHAELWSTDEEPELKASVDLTKTIYNTYESLMDKELPAGEYLLKIYAKDNVGNEKVYEITEYLTDTIYVEYVSPTSCSVNAEVGGSCDFNFNICMRGGNNIQMWMNKIAGLVTPAMLNAEISKGEDNAFVGLKHPQGEGYYESDAGLLPLTSCDEEINGRTNFNLHLDFDSEATQNIGPGAHGLEYWIESSLVECSEIPENNETNQTEPEPQGHIVINEFMVNPAGENSSEWIELYNPTESDFNLTGWILNDGASWNHMLEGTLNSEEYLVVQMPSKLNNDGDLIELRNNYESVIDSVTYGDWDDGNTEDNAPVSEIKGESTGRYPNGQDTDVDNVDFIIFSNPTPEYENIITV